MLFSLRLCYLVHFCTIWCARFFMALQRNILHSSFDCLICFIGVVKWLNWRKCVGYMGILSWMLASNRCRKGKKGYNRHIIFKHVLFMHLNQILSSWRWRQYINIGTSWAHMVLKFKRWPSFEEWQQLQNLQTYIF